MRASSEGINMRAALLVLGLTISAFGAPGETATQSHRAGVSSLSNVALIDAAPGKNDCQFVDGNERAESTELRARIVSGRISDDQWRRLLLEKGVIYSRVRWRAGDTYAIGMQCPTWLGQGAEVSATPRLAEARTATAYSTWGGCALGNDLIRDRQRRQEIGRVPANREEVVFDVKVRARGGFGERGDFRWDGHVAIPLEVVQDEHAILVPVENLELEAAIKGALEITIGKNYADPPRTAMWLSCNYHKSISPYVGKMSLRAPFRMTRRGSGGRSGYSRV